MSFRYRDDIRYSINSPSRGEKKNSPHAHSVHRLQQIDRADQIVSDVHFRIEVAGPRDCCAQEMEDRVHTGERFNQRHPVSEIGELILDPRQGRAKPLRLTVKDADGVPVCQQLVDNMRSNEAAAADHENFLHSRSIRVVVQAVNRRREPA